MVVMDKWTFRVVVWNCLVKGGVQTTRFQLWVRSRVGAGERSDDRRRGGLAVRVAYYCASCRV